MNVHESTRSRLATSTPGNRIAKAAALVALTFLPVLAYAQVGRTPGSAGVAAGGGASYTAVRAT